LALKRDAQFQVIEKITKFFHSTSPICNFLSFFKLKGTDNDQADTTLNQSGLWGLSFTNYVIGNRFANNFNGMLYQEQGFGGILIFNILVLDFIWVFFKKSYSVRNDLS